MSSPAKVVAQAKALEENNNSGDIVTPWDVASTSETGVDYDKLICKSTLDLD